MIVCTKSTQLFMRKAFSAEDVISTSFADAIASFALDPTLNNPAHDLYIVTTDDVKSRKQIAEFTSACANKHPKTKVLYISKRAKGDPIQPGLQGLDGYIVNPKGEQVKEEVARIIDTDSIAAVAEIQEREYENQFANPSKLSQFGSNDYPEETYEGEQDAVYENVEEQYDTIPEFDQNAAYENSEQFTESQPVQEEIPMEVPEMEVPEIKEEAPVIEDQADENVESEILRRIQNSRKVANIDAYMHELNASRLIKDMVQTNSTYAAIEDRLKSINNAIFEIMKKDNEYKTITEKLSAVRALLHDRAFMASKGDTLLEQRLEEVIDTICSKTAELANETLDKVYTGIKQIKTDQEIDAGNARLGGLSQERVNLTLELTLLQAEINNIYKATDELCADTIKQISSRSVDLTGSYELNNKIKTTGDTLVSDETLTAIRAISDYASERLPETFKDMLRKVVTMVRMYNDILAVDREIIAAQQATIDYLKAKNVEDSIVAETLLKKSLRVFVGEEGTGRTIVPYLLSYYKSRQNANVLLLDITGSGKYDEYDILVMTPESFFTNQNQQEFCVVSGAVPNTIAMAQRIVTAVNKAADYYRVINVVMRPDQKELFDNIAADCLSVNYIVTPNTANIKRAKEYIAETRLPNVAQRVILNQCNVPIAPIISGLGLNDVLDIQCCVIPTINEITDAAIRHYNPYGISSVSILMEDVLKYA